MQYLCNGKLEQQKTSFLDTSKSGLIIGLRLISKGLSRFIFHIPIIWPKSNLICNKPSPVCSNTWLYLIF